MQEMTEQKALWQSLSTVIAAALIALAFVFFIVGPHFSEWPAVIVIVLVPALFLIPLVYIRYTKGRPRPTRRQHIRRALLYGALTTLYIIISFKDPKVSWKSPQVWLFPAGWMTVAFDNLYYAHKKKPGDLATPS